MHKHNTWRRLGYALSFLIVAGVAAVVSYGHIREVAVYGHQTDLVAHLIPLSIDGMMLIATLAMAEDKAAKHAELVETYREKFANPYVAAAKGYMDAVILPSETRPRIIESLAMLENKRDGLPPKKHGNIPL